METLVKIQDRKNKKTTMNNRRTRTEKVKAHRMHRSKQADEEEHWSRQAEIRGRAILNPLEIETAYTDHSIDVTEPTIEETRIAIRQIKCGKATAPDNIPAKARMSHIKVTANMLHVLFRKIQRDDYAPMD
ncbi:unnamed protein product [Schistosoma mattheei]|uniref:Uncharacterized protein n=1 Tax=Schistosoma mattheei TaxID=31246 RepID=A0A183PVZ7_9TREM|nr:unnamed protein product [Schistosoma mattheei]